MPGPAVALRRRHHRRARRVQPTLSSRVSESAQGVLEKRRAKFGRFLLLHARLAQTLYRGFKQRSKEAVRQGQCGFKKKQMLARDQDRMAVKRASDSLCEADSGTIARNDESISQCANCSDTSDCGAATAEFRLKQGVVRRFAKQNDFPRPVKLFQICQRRKRAFRKAEHNKAGGLEIRKLANRSSSAQCIRNAGRQPIRSGSRPDPIGAQASGRGRRSCGPRSPRRRAPTTASRSGGRDANSRYIFCAQ